MLRAPAVGGSVPAGVCPNYIREVSQPGDSDYADMAAYAGEQPSKEHQLLVGHVQGCAHGPDHVQRPVGAAW